MIILIIFGVVLAYLLGSLPTAYIFGKTLKNIDIREHGSGNMGATNVFRTVGKTPGLIVLVIDFLKGLLAVTMIPIILKRFIPAYAENSAWILILFGVAVICGHVWTIFLNFKGGKGVATTAGVLAGISPLILILCLAVFSTVFYIWRYVSLGSIIAALFLPIFAVIFNNNIYYVLFCSGLTILAIIKHRENIRRLIRGEEKRLI
ncbi:MAG: glycerol-3-phosphate 1-O-acyltransferase PlsY [Candidatus Omnitrophica bacterium]|nr:glycerol-3-phosphate 1-O-acyltransferase PlsY [Candidatus Omnitrophota bacterium]